MNWNQREINGEVQKLGVHAFIGKLKDGSIATYQVQEWNHKCYHCGVGTSGLSGNTNYISFEICEDDLTNKDYFEATYKEAVELCTYLCKLYNLDPLKNIVCHHSCLILYHQDQTLNLIAKIKIISINNDNT